MAIPQSSNGSLTKAHVNLMTDTVIANLSPDALRSVIRSILTTDPGFTSTFEEHARKNLRKTSPTSLGTLFEQDIATAWHVTTHFAVAQHRIRAMIGSGLAVDSLRHIKQVVDQVKTVCPAEGSSHGDELENHITSVDGDIVQALTAIQKTLNQPSGQRELNLDEIQELDELFRSLVLCRERWEAEKQEFLFERSLGVIAGVLGKQVESRDEIYSQTDSQHLTCSNDSRTIETFQIGDKTLPRLFSGLWQLSSPSWGVAPKSKIFSQFWKFVGQGFTAYDMADHYGDAEILFVS